MKRSTRVRKLWLVFGAVQTISAMALFVALVLQEPMSLAISFLYALPGSLIAFAISKPGHVGADWSFWTLSAIAVVVNALLFTIALFLLERFRRSK